MTNWNNLLLVGFRTFSSFSNIVGSRIRTLPFLRVLSKRFSNVTEAVVAGHTAMMEMKGSLLGSIYSRALLQNLRNSSICLLCILCNQFGVATLHQIYDYMISMKTSTWSGRHFLIDLQDALQSRCCCHRRRWTRWWLMVHAWWRRRVSADITRNNARQRICGTHSQSYECVRCECQESHVHGVVDGELGQQGLGQTRGSVLYLFCSGASRRETRTVKHSWPLVLRCRISGWCICDC